MKIVHFLPSCVVVGISVTIAHATIDISVNVHFVPPLVTGYCQFGRWWNPAEVTCATCFCMTGFLSRCFPTPGCSPIQINDPTPPATDPPPSPTTTAVDPTDTQEATTGITIQENPSTSTTTGTPTSSASSTTSAATTTTTTVRTTTTTRRAARRHPH